MEDYYFKRSHVPAFGSWDCNEDLPFTQCFESARQAGLLRYTYPDQDRDLYVAGDLYENDVLTPTMIVVPRRRVKGTKGGESWVVCDCECGGVKQPPSPPPPSPPRRAPKAVDEDLYKISPEILHSKPRRLFFGKSTHEAKGRREGAFFLAA
ncbi:hypothetical protein M9H77_01121 [Catharanthus roseus]|uniref:Uncharacterized protein n=1 Tax=Catharanthus roseus TaxID=4058 RepID=A0ACC0C4P0_CATRO|nr:hypothetical protein M9H77_01121 [Catharanthus roseus]